MPATSVDQVSRLLNLVPYLRTHPNADVTETAALFGVTPRQLLRDLEVLWFVGLPEGLPGDLIEVDMDAVESEGRIRLSNADFLARPMRFTVDEATSLIVALRAVREVSGGESMAAVDSALAKLSGVAGAGESGRVGFALSSGEAAVRELLANAITDQLAVRLSYDGSTRAETTTPLVEPSRLTVRDGSGYLQAWSVDRDDWRTFRLDRIAGAELTGQPVGDRGEPPEFTAGWLEVRNEAVLITLEVDERARWITEYYPVRSVSQISGGWRVELLVADPAWLRALLLKLGTRVLSVHPAEAADSARVAATEALARYQGLATVG